MILQVHAYLPHTEANGPGVRYGIWVQGCRQRCFGCCNPETHNPKIGRSWKVDELLYLIHQRMPSIEGITLSGGEPLDQSEAVLYLLDHLPLELSVVLYTGYAYEQLKQPEETPRILKRVDVLVHGPYMAEKHVGQHMVGSSNQRVELLSGRYTMHHIQQVPECEIIVLPDGSKIQTGVGAAPKLAH